MKTQEREKPYGSENVGNQVFPNDEHVVEEIATQRKRTRKGRCCVLHVATSKCHRRWGQGEENAWTKAQFSSMEVLQ
jgi:hypothetical protein